MLLLQHSFIKLNGRLSPDEQFKVNRIKAPLGCVGTRITIVRVIKDKRTEHVQRCDAIAMTAQTLKNSYNIVYMSIAESLLTRNSGYTAFKRHLRLNYKSKFKQFHMNVTHNDCYQNCTNDFAP